MHHAPPAKSPTSWGGDRYFGDVELREWIDRYRPDIVLSGHVHQSPFVKDGSWVDRIGETWVFNAGQQFGAPPTHVIIDTDERRGALVLLGRQSDRAPWRSARAAGAAARGPPRLAHSRGSAELSGPWREVLVLLVDQRLEHLSDHAEMVAVPLELALQVNEIGGRGVEALGEQPAQEERDLGI